MNSGPITEADVLKTLSRVSHPDLGGYTGGNVVANGLIQGLSIDGGAVSFAIEVSAQEGPKSEPLRLLCVKAVEALPGVSSVSAVLTAHSDGNAPLPPSRDDKNPIEHAAHFSAAKSETAPPTAEKPKASSPFTQEPIPGIDRIIAVASGKGGVGKSTVAVNLAVCLAKMGKRVGLLDADIYGPSLPLMLGLKDKPYSDGKKLHPIFAAGLKVMSIGLLVDPDQPMIWRGPMVMSALKQMLRDVEWGSLDVLVVDMPPGTGDAQLTLVQNVPLSGAVIVSTPQEIALADARKGLAMFQKTDVPVLGLIENMAYFISPESGEKSYIFGQGGVRKTAEELGCDFLGEIPLHMAIREHCDNGTPIVADDPDAPESRAFYQIAGKLARNFAPVK